MAKFKKGDKVQSVHLRNEGEVLDVGNARYFVRWADGREETYPIENMDDRYELKLKQYIVELRTPKQGERFIEVRDGLDGLVIVPASWDFQHTEAPVIVGEL